MPFSSAFSGKLERAAGDGTGGQSYRHGVPVKWAPADVPERNVLPPATHPHPCAAVAATDRVRRAPGRVAGSLRQPCCWAAGWRVAFAPRPVSAVLAWNISPLKCCGLYGTMIFVGIGRKGEP